MSVKAFKMLFFIFFACNSCVILSQFFKSPVGLGFISPEQNCYFPLLFIRFFITLLYLGENNWINLHNLDEIPFFYQPLSLSLLLPTGEEAGLCLFGALCRGAAGSRSALHFHFSARLEGAALFTRFTFPSDLDFLTVDRNTSVKLRIALIIRL